MKVNKGTKKASIGAAIALALYALFATACKPIDNTEYVKILATTNAADVLNGSQASGHAEYFGNGISNSKPFGVQADLGSTPKGTTKSFDVKLYGDGALPRYFNSVDLGGTVTIDTNVLKDPNSFMLNEFLNYFRFCNNVNQRWNVRNIKVSFNPNRTTGERLPQAYIDGVKSSVLEMKDDSNGFIQTVDFDENGNYPDDASVPADGEIRVYHVTDGPSVSNITYPSGGDQVKSGKLLFNPRAPPEATWHETKDVFFLGEQNLDAPATRDQARIWYRFTFKHMAGGSYRIYIDHEEQTGLDDFVTVTNGPSYVFTNMSNNGLLGNPFGPGEGFDGAVPRRDTGEKPKRGGEKVSKEEY